MKAKDKTVKAWDRDIICIPQSRRNIMQGGNFMNPRGKHHSYLESIGLIGKLHLTSEMSKEYVVAEITSVFKVQMDENPHFAFVYFQTTGGGSKSLRIPSQSSIDAAISSTSFWAVWLNFIYLLKIN